MIDRPFEGLRVLDVGQFIAVPYLTQVLGWLGAEVILVENPKLQSMRIIPPFADAQPGLNRAAGFNLLNTNKRALVLELNSPQGLEVAKRLIAVADVVVENFATGVVEKLGLDYGSVRGSRPDLVYLSIAAFGRSGPLRDFAGFHSVVNLFSGVAAVTGYTGGHPRILGGFPPDFLGGCYSLLAVLEALHHRRRTGEGQHIEVSMTEAFTTLIPEAVANFSMSGVEPERTGNRDGVHAPHEIYRCKGNQRWVAIAVSSDDEWRRLCVVAKRGEWIEDTRFRSQADRLANQDALDTAIEGWTVEQDAEALAAALQADGVAASVVANAADLLRDPHLRERQFVASVQHPETGLRPMGTTAWRMDGTRPREFTHAPLYGADSRGVLSDVLGMGDAEIDQLEADGVVVSQAYP